MVAKACRILIVDDSPEDRELYCRRLTQAGNGSYQFDQAEQGDQGLQLCRANQPDCVLLDYNLPDLNGLEFLDRLHALEGQAAPAVVMLTGQGNEAVAVQAMKHGAQDYLVKGLADNSAMLRHAVQTAIDKVDLQRQVDEQRRQLEQAAQALRVSEEQLRQRVLDLADAGRRKDEFLAMLAHELRNPLGPILNCVQVLRLAGPCQKDAEQARDMIERQVRHLARLVDDLLDVARITRGKVQLHRHRLDLVRLVSTAVKDRRCSLEAAGLVLGLEAPETPLWVSGDPTRLTQIVNNLLDNAAKFTDRGGRVTVRVRADAAHRQVQVAVQDSGIGIEPDVLPRLFNVFAQADRSLDRSLGGLGLGLALIKGLVELHGGEVEATSAGLGRGSEFVVRLPLQDEPAALSQSLPPARPAEKRLRILVVEDNPDAAESLRLLLQLLGHEVAVAHTGPDGVATAQRWKPDTVLCDIGLPGMDGYGVARCLRQQRDLAGVRLVAVTGYGLDDDRRRSHEAGFECHLVKPVDPTVLVHALTKDLASLRPN